MRLETGEIVPARCDSYSCPACLRWRVQEWIWLLAYGLPERFIVLTQVPEDRDKRRAYMKDVRHRLRERGYAMDDAWTTEENPRKTGFHVNVLQHGDYIPHRVLHQVVGKRRVSINALEHGDRSARYVLKEAVQQFAAVGYSLKESIVSVDRRPVHLSRGYLRGYTVKEARKEVKKLRWGETEGTWVKRVMSERDIWERFGKGQSE